MKTIYKIEMNLAGCGFYVYVDATSEKEAIAIATKDYNTATVLSVQK
jgi:hypothetical protein